MSSTEERRYPGWPDKAYPEVFTTIPPNQPKERKPGQFTQQQLKQFFEEGFVQVDDYFTRDELDPVRDATAESVDKLADTLYEAGKIKNLHKDAGFLQRLTLIDNEFPGANIVLLKLGRLPDAYRKLWSNEKALNLAEQLLGTQDIQGNPSWNLRTKIPNNTATTVPWHQDSAYFDPDLYGEMVASAWIPLLDSNKENGCMEMVRGGHRKGLMGKHKGPWKDTFYLELPEEKMEKTLGVDMEKDIVLCEVPYGGAVFFSNIIPHRSLPNVSNDIRWAIDLRWQRLVAPAGMFGLKDGVQLRSSTDPNFTIDWDSFVAKDRNKLGNKSCGESDDDLVPILAGPWMKQWELVGSNKHTVAVQKQLASRQ